MNITKIEAISLKHNVGAPYGMSRGLINARSSTIVVVSTDEGIIGVGETWGGKSVV